MYTITINLKNSFYTVYATSLKTAAQVVLDAIKLFGVCGWTIEGQTERYTALRSPFGWGWVTKNNDFESLFNNCFYR